MRIALVIDEEVQYDKDGNTIYREVDNINYINMEKPKDVLEMKYFYDKLREASKIPFKYFGQRDVEED